MGNKGMLELKSGEIGGNNKFGRKQHGYTGTEKITNSKGGFGTGEIFSWARLLSKYKRTVAGVLGRSVIWSDILGGGRGEERGETTRTGLHPRG